MLSTLFLVMRLTLFVDQCDGNVCSVAIAGDDEATYFEVSRAAIPACADETVSVSVLERKCYRFHAIDDTTGIQIEIPAGDISL